MATLTGNKIKDTYDSLIKLSDNGNLTATLKLLSDGFGNSSGVYLNTAGDFKSTGTIEFTNFKATAHAVTINKLVNQAGGISNNDNDTSLPTSAAVKDYVDTHVTSQDLDFTDGTTQSAIDLDSQVFSIIGTNNEIETSASGQQLQIGLPNSVTISGTYTGATFSGDLNGTINTATTAVTQSAGNNSTKVATTAYVDTLDAASDLDFSGDSGTGDVNLNTKVLAVTGTANQIVTTANNQGLSLAFPTTITIPNNSVATTQSAGDNSTKVATTAYVDTLDAASDLDITGDTGTGAVNLNTQSLDFRGTSNQIITTISGKTATFSLPATVHRNLQGNVTGNADTATTWQTARDLSLTSEATGTLSSVNGSGNVSGAVTLLNSAVTGKVLTGLGTPAAGNIIASDSILEAFGKVQSQLNTSKNGLVFKGTWSAATNTPTLTSGGGETDAGTTTSTVTNKLVDSSQNFLTTISNGNKVINQADGSTALVTNVDSNTTLTLDADIMLSGEAYTIDASPFLQQGQYYVVNVGGTTNLNGNANWAVGDWVIAGASNTWEKLDHSQVDGTGTPGKLTKWATVNTLQDSIVGESGTALTVTGSLATTLGASVAGDFAVNTNKFTVNATNGNTLIAGNLDFPNLSDILMVDNSSAALEFKEGSNLYLRFVTTNSGEKIEINKNIEAQGITSTSATFTGNVAINGNATLGDGTADNHIINGEVTHLTADALGYKLHRTAGGTSILISATGDAELEFGTDNGSGTNTTQWTIGKDGTDNSFRISNSASLGTSDALTIDSSENATFAGSVNITGGTTNGLNITTSGTQDTIKIDRAATSDNAITKYQTASADKWIVGLRNTGDDNFRFYSYGTSSDVLTINQADGNATFASNNIDIKGSSAGNTQIRIADSAGTLGSNSFDLINDGSAAYVWNRKQTDLNFATYGSLRMKIRASGTVGIGANGGYDSQMLSIDAGVLDGAIYATSTDANCFASFRDNSSTVNVEYGARGNDHVLRKDGTDYFVVNNVGDVYNFKSATNANTFYGYDAGSYNATGASNTAMGYEAGGALTTGTQNVCFGRNSGDKLTTGINNVNIGTNAGFSNTDGQQNVYVGTAAGYTSPGQNYNTFVGHESGFNNQANENTAVGRMSLQANTSGNRNVGIGYNALRLNTTGVANTALGALALENNVDGDSNTALGYQAADANTTGDANTAIGTNSLGANSTGSRNTTVGNNSGLKITGSDTVAIGYEALAALTSNGQNVGIGVNAGLKFTGSRLVAIGYGAGKELLSDVDNVFIGQQAGENRTTGTDNTFVGAYANYNGAATGCCNTGVGKSTGYSLTSGVQNTFVGRQAGYSVTDGGNNTMVGHNTGIFVTGSDNTYVGSYAGDASSSSGSYNTGIGRAGLSALTSGTYHTALGYNAGDEITTGTNCTALGHAAGSGSSPRHMTTNSNEIVIGNNNIVGAYIRVAWTATSDARDKTEFKEIPRGLDFVSKLKPTSYKFRKDRDSEETQGRERYGFLAQEVLELEGDNPVIIDNTDEDKLAYTESNLVPVLVKAIQELKAEVDLLKQECKCK